MKRYAIIFLIILSQPSFATQEALFKYNSLQTVRLIINCSPIETKSGFMRLAGIISGPNYSAVVELGGKGSIIKKGSRIGDYLVKSISEKGVYLCLGN